MSIHRPTLRSFATLALVALLAACTSNPAPASQPPSSPSQPSNIPASPAPSADPSAEPSATPSPTPKPLAWADPVAVDALARCYSVVPTVDSQGGIHVAASCPDGLRYATTRDGSRWTSDRFRFPDGRDDIDPLVAVSGDTVVFAWTREAETEGGCGDDGLKDLGVYVRTRKLDQDAWSPAERIGAAGDHLQALRFVGSTLHAIVDSEDGTRIWYERVENGEATRFELSPGVSGTAALRIANNGQPHVILQSGGELHYAVLGGDAVYPLAISDTKDGIDPTFVLGTDDTAYLLFSRNNVLGGCAEPDPLPTNGVYFSSNAGGAWKTTKLSDRVGNATLTVDPDTDEVHAVVGDFEKVEYLHKPAGGDWTKGPQFDANGMITSVSIRQNPVSGDLFVMYAIDSSGVNSDPTFSVMLVRQR
jgi:hypothetical protein